MRKLATFVVFGFVVLSAALSHADSKTVTLSVSGMT